MKLREGRYDYTVTGNNGNLLVKVDIQYYTGNSSHLLVKMGAVITLSRAVTAIYW
jgi:hypothetical protein